MFKVKHFGIILDLFLYFNKNLKQVLVKVNILVVPLRKLHNSLPRRYLLLIIIPFIRQHANFCDGIFNNILSKFLLFFFFCNRLDSSEHNTRLVLIRGAR